MLLPDEKPTTRHGLAMVQLEAPKGRPLLPAGILQMLGEDDPEHRRRVYIRFADNHAREMVRLLEQSGFDMNSLRLPRQYATGPEDFCVITGSAASILRFVQAHPKILSLSVHFAEYAWLSSAPCNAK